MSFQFHVCVAGFSTVFNIDTKTMYAGITPRYKMCSVNDGRNVSISLPFDIQEDDSNLDSRPGVRVKNYPPFILPVYLNTD